MNVHMLTEPRRFKCETLTQIDTLLAALDIGEPARRAIMTLVYEHAIPSPPGARKGGTGGPPRTLGQIARLFHKLSVQRNEAIGAVVTRDDRWNMLLDLFAAAEEGRLISVSSLAVGAASPATTALRHIESLLRAGLIERVADPDDRRRTWVMLTPRTRERMGDIIRGFTIPWREPPPATD